MVEPTPLKKYARQKWESSPNRGEHKKIVENHHLDLETNNSFFAWKNGTFALEIVRAKKGQLKLPSCFMFD